MLLATYIHTDTHKTFWFTIVLFVYLMVCVMIMKQVDFTIIRQLILAVRMLVPVTSQCESIYLYRIRFLQSSLSLQDMTLSSGWSVTSQKLHQNHVCAKALFGSPITPKPSLFKKRWQPLHRWDVTLSIKLMWQKILWHLNPKTKNALAVIGKKSRWGVLHYRDCRVGGPCHCYFIWCSPQL